MAKFSLCFGKDTYTLAANDKLAARDSLRLYNLFYLSKLIANENLETPEKAKVYYAVNSLMPNKKIPPDSFLYNFMNENKEFHKIRYKNEIINNLKSLDNYKKSIISSLKSNELFEKVKNDFKNKECLDDLNIKANNLKNYYPKNDFNKIKKANEFSCNNQNFIISEKAKNINRILFNQKLKDKLNEKIINDSVNRDKINAQIRILDQSEIYSEQQYQEMKSNLKEFEIDLEGYLQNDIVLIDKDKLINEIDTAVKKNEKTFNDNIDFLSETLATSYLESNKHNNTINIDNSISSSKTSLQQININAQIQTAQAQTGSSGIKIPSQSQMIEAMAIFLAKRAKQEAAIWFMDQIRLKMNNPMIMDVFPETLKVMEGVENYKVPTFNTTWKYAIAKDFVEMPRNLVKSPWVEKFIIKDSTNHARLKQSIDFGYDLNRLMTEQYNYRDIIKYFYINPRLKIEKNGNDVINQDINRLIDNGTAFLYIITNEFFSIDNIDAKNVYRLLSYEEIAGLSPKEYKILIELIELKYRDRIADFKILENLKFEENEEGVKKRGKVNKWMGNILISLSQFDKIRNDLKIKQDDIKDDLASKNFYNIWNLLNQMITNLQGSDLIKSDKIKNIDIKVKWVQKGMSVYEHFQSNDYVGAANEAFSLMNMVKNTYNQEYVSKNYVYQFGIKKQVSLTYLHEDKKFKITNEVNKNHIITYFENNHLVLENLIGHKLILNDFQVIAKYISNNTSIKYLKDFYGENMHQKIQQIHEFSEVLNLEDAEMLKMINSTLIFKNALNNKENVGEILKNLKFTLSEADKNSLADNNEKYTKQLTNLLSFFGDVLTVKDEHQLAGVIDSYALPPTSYKLKRKQHHSIDLNAYVGAFGGGLMSFKSSVISSQFVYGITAPIGVAFTWLREGWYDNYGFTIDVVDLGNVVNHYLVKPGENYAKDVHFSEVFSLGTTFLMGIKNSPFVLSGGFRFQPFNTGKDGNNKVFDAGIFHLGIKIDIPLIHLSGKDF